jgi:hypothetical protein
VKEDRLREVKPRVGGLMCLSRMFHNLPYVCSMNPVLGHEYEPEYRVEPTGHLVVIAGPRVAFNALTSDLMFSCDELYTVGEAVAPRNVCDAVHEGYKIGARI